MQLFEEWNRRMKVRLLNMYEKMWIFVDIRRQSMTKGVTRSSEMDNALGYFVKLLET